VRTIVRIARGIASTSYPSPPSEAPRCGHRLGVLIAPSAVDIRGTLAAPAHTPLEALHVLADHDAARPATERARALEPARRSLGLGLRARGHTHASHGTSPNMRTTA